MEEEEDPSFGDPEEKKHDDKILTEKEQKDKKHHKGKKEKHHKKEKHEKDENNEEPTED